MSSPFYAEPSSPFAIDAAPSLPVNQQAAERRKSRTRVLQVINGEHYSGAERVQDLLALGLPHLGFETAFACVKPGKFDELRQAKRTPLHNAKMRSQFDMRVALQLGRILRKNRYHLLHAHTPRSLLVARIAARIGGAKFIYHVHSPTSRDSTRPIQNRLNQMVEKFSISGASRLITVSRSLADHMYEQGFGEDMVCVVPNGVPTPIEIPDRQPPSGSWVLGTVALFRQRKGTEYLLKAMRILLDQGVDVVLNAVGGFETAEYEQQVKTLVAELRLEENVNWVGFTSDVTAELFKMDLFVLPSLFGEGLPMVVLESMACGVPVVGTLVEGVPEAIREGQEGVLAEPSNEGDLARAMMRVIGGEVCWEKLRKNARRRQQELFSDKSMSAGVADVYRRVLRRATRHTGT